jgi:iron complex outermembrane receptor protein
MFPKSTRMISSVALALAVVLGPFDAGIAAEEVSAAQGPDETDDPDRREAGGTSGEKPQLTNVPDVEEIIITGERGSAASAIQEQENAVTTFDTSSIEAIGAQDISDLASFTPNLEIVTAGSTSPTLFIRGVGLNDFAAISGGAIAVYDNDVPKNSPALQLSKIFDVESVAVLRGPQGTGPYRNASGGAIKVFSKKPSGDFSGFLNVSYGNYDFIDVEGAIELPLFEGILSNRTAFAVTKRDGYLTNRCADAPPFSERQVATTPIGTDPRWSICGENVTRNQKSEIPVGLPGEVNAIQNWAGRSVFQITPNTDTEMDWLFIVQGSQRRDESRLGQAMGAVGTITVPAPGEDAVQGGLGGFDQRRYRDVDVEQRRTELFRELTAHCSPSCTPAENQAANLSRNTIVSRELALNLDTGPWDGAYDRVGPTNNDVWGLSLNGSVAVTDHIEIRSITGFDAYDRLIDIDLDFSPNVLFEIVTKDEGWQFTQEFRVGGALNTSQPVSWEIGALYLHEVLDVRVDNDFGRLQAFNEASREYDQTTQTAIAYLQGDLGLSERWTLDGGFRYNYERKQINYALEYLGDSLFDSRDLSWGAPTGMLRLTYAPHDELSFYGKYTRGWKSGNFNATGNIRRGITNAEPETINSYEVGLTSTFFDSRLMLYGSLFYYDYDDYQLFTVDNNFGSLPEFVTINASNVEVYGAEIEATTNPWEGAFGQLRFGWLESQFLDFTQRQLIQAGGEVYSIDIDNTGNRLLNSPQFTLSLTAEQDFFLGSLSRFGALVLRYDGAWRDDTFFDGTEGRGIQNEDGDLFLPPLAIGQQAFWLHNLRLTYRTPQDRVEVSAWVRNLTNEAYKEYSFDATTFQGTTIHWVGEPRMFGMTVALRF